MATPQWVVLRRSPRTSPDLPEGAGISLALEAPPRTSQLVVSPSVVFSGSGILAADPSGILLLSGMEDPAAAGDDQPYYLYDVVSRTSIHVPAPDTPLPGTAGGVAGLLVVPGRFGRDQITIVAELCVSGRSVTLRCFSTETCKWMHKVLSTPLPPIKGQWRSAYALSYKGRLWWVDILQGLLSCNPFADNAELHYVPLPGRYRLLKHSSSEESHRKGLSDHRCVSLSCGKLRLAVINRRTSLPAIKLWTLADHEAGKWTLDFDVPIEMIWLHSSYWNIGLPTERPAVRFVHPSNAHVVYFSIEQELFAVDLYTRVTEGASNEKDGGDLVLPLELPPSLRIMSSSGPQESSSRFCFDSVAGFFSEAYGHALADMEFHQFSEMALAYLNRKKKTEDNMFTLSERLSQQTFVQSERMKSYTHLNFYADIGSKRVLVFAEFSSDAVADNERDEWTLLSCKLLTKNYHGGLFGEDVASALRQSTARKRKRSIFCLSCAAELLHPTSGFEGGYLGASFD